MDSIGCETPEYKSRRTFAKLSRDCLEGKLFNVDGLVVVRCHNSCFLPSSFIYPSRVATFPFAFYESRSVVSRNA